MKGYGKFTITNLFGAQIIEHYSEDIDATETGVFIPIERNGLELTRNKNVNCYFYICENLYPTSAQWTHYFQLAMPKDVFAKWRDLGYTRPYVGNMKSTNWGYGTVNRIGGKVKRID